MAKRVWPKKWPHMDMGQEIVLVIIWSLSNTLVKELFSFSKVLVLMLFWWKSVGLSVDLKKELSKFLYRIYLKIPEFYNISVQNQETW